MFHREKAAWLVLISITWFCTKVQGQVINIESRRLHTDSVRRAGDFNFAFLYNNTNSKAIYTLRGNLAAQVKSKNYRHLWLLVANYDVAKAEGADYVNAFFLHLRYNYKVNDWLRWEGFTQSQTNEPLGIAFRQLTGTGPRFKVNLKGRFNLYLGLAYMYEYEKTTGNEMRRNYHSRMSSYASVSWSIPHINSDFVSTLYYQPLFGDISDFRLMNETRIDFRITSKFRIYTRLNFYNDSKPPIGIRNDSFGWEQGFGLSL